MPYWQVRCWRIAGCKRAVASPKRGPVRPRCPLSGTAFMLMWPLDTAMYRTLKTQRPGIHYRSMRTALKTPYFWGKPVCCGSRCTRCPTYKSYTSSWYLLKRCYLHLKDLKSKRSGKSGKSGGAGGEVQKAEDAIDYEDEEDLVDYIPEATDADAV